MSIELINRITIKKDGVYISTHSNNDTSPYHSVKIDMLTEAYLTGGQRELDLKIVDMLFSFCDLRGSHKSVIPYKNAIHIALTNQEFARLRNEYDLIQDKAFNIANRFGKYMNISKQESEELYEKIKPEVEMLRNRRNEFVVNIVEGERRKIQEHENLKKLRQTIRPKEISKGIYSIIPIHTIHEKSGEAWSEYMNFNTNEGTIVYDKTLGNCLPSPEIFTISEFQELIHIKGFDDVNGAKEFQQFIIKYPDIYMEGINNEEQNQKETEEEEYGQDY